MIFSTLQARFAQFLRSGDTTDPVISTTLRDIMLNEAWRHYEALYGVGFTYSAEIAKSSNVFTVPIGALQVLLEVEMLEIKSLDFIPSFGPMSRQTYGQVLSLSRGEGAVGTPSIYATALFSRIMSANSTSVRFAVYPIPDQSYDFRVRYRTLYPVDLSAAGDVISGLTDVQADYIARMAAANAGEILGYGREWVAAIMAPVHDATTHDVKMDDYNRWPQAVPRRLSDQPEGKGFRN